MTHLKCQVRLERFLSISNRLYSTGNLNIFKIFIRQEMNQSKIIYSNNEYMEKKGFENYHNDNREGEIICIIR